MGPYSAGMGPTGPRRRHQVLQSSQRWGAEVPGLALRAFSLSGTGSKIDAYIDTAAMGIHRR